MKKISRISLFGPMGIGKTTAIRTLCGDLAVDCDVPNLDLASNSKELTTVGTDLGEIDLGGGEWVQIYGCPGQDRFAFIWRWLISVSLGVFIMVDVNDPQAVDQANTMLDHVAQAQPQPMALVMSARPAAADMIDAFASALAQRRNEVVPVIQVDVRERQQMIDALAAMVSMISLQGEVQAEPA